MNTTGFLKSLIRYLPIVFIVIFALLMLFVAFVIIRMIVRWKREIKNFMPEGTSLNDIKDAISNGLEETKNPSQRTLFGATSIYLPKVTEDFTDYHFPEAKAALSVLINEYLNIRFGGSDKFLKSNVSEGLASTVPHEADSGEVTNYRFHEAAIKNYVKTSEYATITYVATAGFSAGGRNYEERYVIDSTLRLTDQGIPNRILICERCGGAVKDTKSKVCPFCGSGIVWDTRMSWLFASIDRN